MDPETSTTKWMTAGLRLLPLLCLKEAVGGARKLGGDGARKVDTLPTIGV